MEGNCLNQPIKVLVTGANGKIACSLIPQLLSGSAFGEDQPIILHLLSRNESKLLGLAMEIEDCAFPLHRGTVATSDVRAAFSGVDVAILLASVSRGDAVRRTDLLILNTYTTRCHGNALENYAKRSVKVLVVTNPCNTMTYVCRQAAPSIPTSAFTCLTQLDYNRALYQVNKHFQYSLKPGFPRKIGIFGNHSEKVSVCLSGVSVPGHGDGFTQRVSESDEEDIQKAVQGRGHGVIVKKKSTSAFSVTAALIGHLRAWWLGTDVDQWVSMGVVSDGCYGVPSGLVCSFPVVVSKDKELVVVRDLHLSKSTERSLRDSISQLREEKDMADKALSAAESPCCGRCCPVGR